MQPITSATVVATTARANDITLFASLELSKSKCRVDGDVAVPIPRSGGTEARTGLRMMPTFPQSPLTFRTAGFPQYG